QRKTNRSARRGILRGLVRVTYTRQFRARFRGWSNLFVTSQRGHSRRSESLSRTHFCQAKIQNLGLAPMSHEDVRRLDVAVDDVSAMCRIERIGYFDAKIDQRRFVHWLPANALP